MDLNNFQRIGSVHNAGVGAEFERIAARFFEQKGIRLSFNFPTSVGAGGTKKIRRFDLGSDDPPVLVECKSHTWTQGKNIPSAKLTVWNEAMYYFHIAPEQYRKILFVLKHCRNEITLASYYIANFGHMIPEGVEIWEYCTKENDGGRVF